MMEEMAATRAAYEKRVEAGESLLQTPLNACKFPDGEICRDWWILERNVSIPSLSLIDWNRFLTLVVDLGGRDMYT